MRTIDVKSIDALTDVATLQRLERDLDALTHYVRAKKDVARIVQGDLAQDPATMRGPSERRLAVPDAIAW